MHTQSISALRTCEGCGSSYKPKRDTRGRFCSLACYNRAQGSAAPIANCKQCGKDFRYHPSSPRSFCSRECWREDRSGTDAFWRMVDKSGDCWIWKGAIGTDGYGKRSRKNQSTRAHRMAYEMARGPIPEGMVICHTCDNPPCVRPDHLWAGTVADNARDMAAKGRASRKVSNAKLNVAIANDIRAEYRQGGVTMRGLALKYDVAESSVNRIINNKSWVEGQVQPVPPTPQSDHSDHLAA